jgi:hypothetical protein
MNHVKRLVVTLSLISVLSITSFAGDINTSPCTPPDPGQMSTPPCATAQLATDDATNSGQPDAPPEADAMVIVTIVDAAIEALLSVW